MFFANERRISEIQQFGHLQVFVPLIAHIVYFEGKLAIVDVLRSAGDDTSDNNQIASLFFRVCFLVPGLREQGFRLRYGEYIRVVGVEGKLILSLDGLRDLDIRQRRTPAGKLIERKCRRRRRNGRTTYLHKLLFQHIAIQVGKGNLGVTFRHAVFYMLKDRRYSQVSTYLGKRLVPTRERVAIVFRFRISSRSSSIAAVRHQLTVELCAIPVEEYNRVVGYLLA